MYELNPLECALNEAQAYRNQVDALSAENAKLVDVLHEVEQEAIYAYNCLQQDCEAVVGGQTHFFNKWWHAECECDRLKSQNAKLLRLLRALALCADDNADCDKCVMNGAAYSSVRQTFCDGMAEELQAVGIEVDNDR